MVEMESEAVKTRKLIERVAELERVIGRKQMEIDFQDEVIRLASEHYGEDFKKNFSTGRSRSSEPADPNADTQ